MDLSEFKKNKVFPRNIIFIIVAVIIAVLTGNCTVSPSATAQDGHIIVASILPLVEFASKVGGEKIDVFEMIPPGASSHTYEPTSGQLKKVSRSISIIISSYGKQGLPSFQMVRSAASE